MATKLTQIVANFQTQLSTNVSTGGVTAKLSSKKDSDGNEIPDGKYALTINQGLSNEQHFVCTLTKTALGCDLTDVIGVSRQGVRTTGFRTSARINNEVKLTDYTNILEMMLILSGASTLDKDAPLKYDGQPTTLTDATIVPKKYVDDGLASKAGLSSNNSFTGNNTHTGNESFSQPVSVPNPVGGTDAVNLQTVLGIAMGSVTIFEGFNDFVIAYDEQGRIKSVGDSLVQKTFFIDYHDDGTIRLVQTDDNFWLLDYENGGRILQVNRK
jgi:hypothetical protein